MAFEIGDLVICVSTRPNPSYQPNAKMLERLEEGSFYRVLRYLAPPGRPGVQLVGVDHRPGDGWQAWRFRKVQPADEEFTRLLRARVLEDA